MFKITIAFTMFACTMACFTMPPKTIPFSNWALFYPDLDSPDYKHVVHECPENYYSFLKTSHYVKEKLISNVVKVTIRGYNVCCPIH
jgi:hypothetical protein